MSARVTAALVAAGCVAAEAETAELLASAIKREVDVDELVARRVTGEPLAWITGRTTFCGLVLRVDRGVYVPRRQTEPLALLAARLLPPDGTAVDLCTGTGAIAAVLRAHRPHARVVGTDIEPAAVACARANGVDALVGDLDGPLPADLRGRVDVITAVVPYVPAEALHLLPRDTLVFEPRAAIDGGLGGMRELARVIERTPKWLRHDGALLVELGGDQSEEAAVLLADAGFVTDSVLADEDGDERAIVARLRLVDPA